MGIDGDRWGYREKRAKPAKPEEGNQMSTKKNSGPVLALSERLSKKQKKGWNGMECSTKERTERETIDTWKKEKEKPKSTYKHE